MLLKWTNISITFILIITSGSILNIPNYLADLESWFEFTDAIISIFRITVLFGYLFGLGTGFIYSKLGAGASFVISGLLTLSGYALMGVIIQASEAPMPSENILCITLLLFLTAVANSLSLMAAVSVTVSNFSRASYSLIVLLYMSYLKLSTEFDSCLKQSFFEHHSIRAYLVSLGIIGFVA
jgi:hypothetical protein